MRPTDTTRTCDWSTRQVKESKSYSARQGTSDGQSASCAGAIFLLNFQSPYRESLAVVLRTRHFNVFIPEERNKSLSGLGELELQQADLAIFDLTRINRNIWTQLRRICRVRKPDGMSVMVLCWSRRYHDPVFHLMVEKLGARFICH